MQLSGRKRAREGGDMRLTKEQIETRRNDPNWTDVPDQQDFIDTIDALEARLLELEGIDKACDAANAHVLELKQDLKDQEGWMDEAEVEKFVEAYGAELRKQLADAHIEILILRGQYKEAMQGQFSLASEMADKVNQAVELRTKEAADTLRPWIRGGPHEAILALITTSGTEVLAAHDAKLRAIIERDRTKIAECTTAIKKALQGYEWLIEGRGSYEWDDDRWHEEFAHASQNIKAELEPLVRLAADHSNSPTTWAAIEEARRNVADKVNQAVLAELRTLHQSDENCTCEHTPCHLALRIEELSVPATSQALPATKEKPNER